MLKKFDKILRNAIPFMIGIASVFFAVIIYFNYDSIKKIEKFTSELKVGSKWVENETYKYNTDVFYSTIDNSSYVDEFVLKEIDKEEKYIILSPVKSSDVTIIYDIKDFYINYNEIK